MAEPIDPLEEELASFRPRPLSRELRARIGEELAPTPRRIWPIVASLGGLAAAACVVVGAATWMHRATTNPPIAGHGNPPSVNHNVSTGRAATAGFASPPTVMDLRRAFDESPAALDALLARPAGGGRRDAAPLRAFMRPELESSNDNGDSL